MTKVRQNKHEGIFFEKYKNLYVERLKKEFVRGVILIKE